MKTTFLRAIASAAALLGTSSASAFVLLFNWAGNPERWDTSTVRWTWSGQMPQGLTENATIGAISNAFAAWQNLDCATIAFTAGGQRANDPGDAIHVRFQQGSWDPTVADALAFSSSETYQSGVIASNDLVFNAVDVQWTTTFPPPSGRTDIQSVAMHEIGHAIGLDHTRERTAMMFFTETTAHGRRLHADDRRGACLLYPATTFDDGILCDSCLSNSQCANGVCIDYGSGMAFCGSNCNETTACPEGFTCYRLQGVTSPQCLPDSDRCDVGGRNLPLGAPCYGHDVCTSGFCLVTDDDAFCSNECRRDADCGGGLVCAQGLCFKGGGGGYGDLCTALSDCESLVCASFAPLRARCTENCGTGLPACPSGDRCLPDGICAPGGDRRIGATCSGHDDCEHGFCEDGTCTKPCVGGCPRGTSCEGNFCRGEELGAACDEAGQCAPALRCLDASGTCERICNPLTEFGCEDGEQCLWLAGSGSTVEGRCVPATGGGDVYAGCDGAACEAHLVCQASAAGNLACRRDCRLEDGFGCEFFETCEPLANPSAIPASDRDARRGVCLQKADDGEDTGGGGAQDAGGGVEDAGPPGGPDVGGPAVAEGEAPAPAESDGGCGGGAGGTPLGLLLLAGLRWGARGAGGGGRQARR
jgi:hypothetical protein